MVAAAGLLVGCTSGVETGSSPNPSPPTSVASELLGPLTQLGPCTADPEASADASEARDLILPPGSVLTSVERQDPVTQVQGYVPMTPVQVRVWFTDQSGLEVIQVEDEVIESEVLVTDGQHRLFVKAQAVCALGSVFVGILAPEEAAGEVPTPAGSPAG